MSESLEIEIAALPKLDINQLRAKWRLALKAAPPLHIRKCLLVPLLAYKLQEQAYGGLKPELRRQLSKSISNFNRDPKHSIRSCPEPTRIKPGTRLIRRWEGQTHQVTVGEAGFEYNGNLYKSLSSIARLITGTRWSGPLFFGTKGSR